jgi:hypothetical protein
MRLRKWRPLHGWAEFAYEILKIVLGVLIALGAGAVVDAYHWQGEVASTKEALNLEIAVGASYAVDRIAVEPCLGGRLSHLAKELARPGPWRGEPLPVVAGLSGRRGAVPRVYAAPARPWPKSTWDSIVPSGVFGHMSRNETQLYSAIYRDIEIMRDIQAQEVALAPNLTPLAFDRTLDEPRRDAMLTTVAQLDNLDSRMTTTATQMLPALREAGLLRSPELVDMIDKWPPIQRKLRGSCVRVLRINPRLL